MTGETFLALTTIAAIILGPVAAVLITRKLDDQKLSGQRRMEIFRALMRTRGTRLNPDHVAALNLVEIEFHGEPDVISALKTYMSHLGPEFPRDLEGEEFHAALREGDARLTKLLHAISRSLKFKIEQLDILEGGYAPQGWGIDETQQRALRTYVLELLEGKRGLPITAIQAPGTANPYPPAPPLKRPEESS